MNMTFASLSDLTSRPVLLRVEVKDANGRSTGEVLEHWIHPLTLNDHGDLQRWIDGHFPNPYDEARDAIHRAQEAGKPFNVAIQQFMLKNAAEQAMRPRHLIGSPLASEILLSEEGMKQIIVMGIRKGDPAFDEAAATRLMVSMTEADLLQAYGASQVNLLVEDPKAEPLDVRPKKKPTGSSASRRTRRAAKARTGGSCSTS